VCSYTSHTALRRTPPLAPSMEYARRKYEASLRGDPVAEANRILQDYTLDGGRKAIRFNTSSLLLKEYPDP